MGDLIPLADYTAARAALDHDASPWFRPAPDWDPCEACPIRGACREVRECQEAPGAGITVTRHDSTPPPRLQLRPVGPPDIVA